MNFNTELEFESGRYSLYHLEHFFCYLMDGVVVSNDLRQKIRLCFHEAVTNAVVHGNQYDENKKVFIRIIVENDTLIFTIQDEGNGFELDEIVHPLKEENIEKPSGRGIFLIREYSQHFNYDKSTHTMQIEFKTG